MSDEHHNEPREVGYNKTHKDTFKEWTSKDSNSIFSGLTQADLFFFAMALGHHRKKHSEVKNKANDVPVSALNEAQKWGVLATAIDAKEDLLVLKDEKKIYLSAEEYAEEGIKILKSHIEKQGLNYPKYLEAELRELIGDES
ncbi:hypothetical protein C4573_06480 [Candidatus Woesearchaeota archaeon]|nr:MAG: hypothetical protein C4573_06480 [Candidatus Woesearchaeota archaeon]